MIQEFRYPKERYILIGVVSRAQGLKGELKISCFSGQPENLRNYTELVLIDRQQKLSAPLAVKKNRVQGKNAIIALETVTDRSQADSLKGAGVLVAKESLPEIAEDEFYWHDYIGSSVVDLAGKNIGRVERLFHNGAQDILVVAAAAKEILIPVTKDIVVARKSGSLVIDPPPGLLELNSDNGV
jgi:16S rRNA processing protein RimM